MVKHTIVFAINSYAQKLTFDGYVNDSRSVVFPPIVARISHCVPGSPNSLHQNVIPAEAGSLHQNTNVHTETLSLYI